MHGLMSDMRFEDITVAMLCDRAMIRRTTFYKHFADKSEFFSFYVDSLRGDMVERGRLAIDELEPGVAHTAFAERAAILDAWQITSLSTRRSWTTSLAALPAA